MGRSNKDEDESVGERKGLLSTEPRPPSGTKRKRAKPVPPSSPSQNAEDEAESIGLSQIQNDVSQQKVKRRQTELKAAVQKARYEALKMRRRCLSTVGIFTLLSYHKAEHRLLDSSPQPTREALFLVFFHHLVMHVNSVARMVDSSTPLNGGTQSPSAPVIPTLNIEPAKEIEMSGGDLVNNGRCKRQEMSPIGRQTSQQSSEQEVDSKAKAYAEEVNLRKILRWAKDTARTYLLALKLEQSAGAQRVVRHLDAHVLHLRADDVQGDMRPTESGKRPKRLTGRNKRSTADQSRVHPLVFNPQPPKRHLVTFGGIVQQDVYNRILTPASPRNQQELKPASSARPGMLGSLMNRAQSLRKSGESENDLSFFDALSADQLDSLTNENALRREYSTSNVLCLSDMSERLGHLPTTLLSQLLQVGGLSKTTDEEPGTAPPVTASSAADPVNVQSPMIDEKMRPQVHSAPPLEYADELGALDVLNIPFDKGLINWAFGDPGSSESANPKSNSETSDHLTFQDALSAEVEVPVTPTITPSGTVEVDPASLPSPTKDTDSAQATPPTPYTPPVPAPALHISPTAYQGSMVQAIFRLFPLHTLLFWESMYTLLLSGHWDVMVQETCKQFALSLDIAPEVFELMMAYTAEAVAETVEKASPSVIQHDEGASQDGTSESRSLATTSTKTLRGKTSSAANRGRILKIAGMALGVGALSALTAGIAAPAFAAGVGALGIAGTSGFATFLGTAGGSAALASLFGAGSASLSGWKYSRRLADIKTFEFHHLTSQYVVDAVATYISEVMDYTMTRQRLQIPHGPVLGMSLCTREGRDRKHKPPFQLVIGISGWLKSEEDATRPWQCMSDALGSELFAVKWEPHLLTALGGMIFRMVGEQMASWGASFGIQMTMTAGTGIILWPVSLMQYAGQLDNTWMTCRERAQQAGVLLAAALSDKQLVGHRPVTLIGYSMGSRVISFALRELYKRGEFNRVQHAILMGLPAGKSKDNWRQKRTVVSGRLVNIFCTSDWILVFLYRFMEWGLQVAGLSAIEGVPGVENYDATGLVMSHNDYEKRVPELLSYIGFHSSFADSEIKRARRRS